MNPSNPAATLSGCAPTRSGPTRRVTDAPMRMFHWLFALCFVGAYASADSEHWRLLHVTLGYTLAGLLAFRIVYGLVGPRQARLSQLVRKLAGLPAWLALLRSGAAGQAAWRQGQNLLMALAVTVLLVGVLPVTASGYATYDDWGGDWLEELHEAAGEVFLWLVLAHLGLILGLSLLRRKNQALPMLTGRIAGAGPDLAQRNHGWLAALLVAAVLAFWTWQWLDRPGGLSLGDGAALSQEHARDRHDNDDDDDDD